MTFRMVRNVILLKKNQQNDVPDGPKRHFTIENWQNDVPDIILLKKNQQNDVPDSPKRHFIKEKLAK